MIKPCKRCLLTVWEQNGRKLHFALGERSGFVGKKDVHTACRLYAHRLAHEYAVARHSLDVCRKNDSHHHGKSLGNTGDKHAHRQGECVEQMRKQIRKIGQLDAYEIDLPAAADDKGIKKIRCRHKSRGNVAKNADLLCKLCQPALERALARFDLNLARDLAQKCRIANRSHKHLAAPLGHRASAKERGGGVGSSCRSFKGILAHLAALTCHGRLIGAKRAQKHPPVGGDGIACTQKHNVAHHHLANGNLAHLATAAHAAKDAARILLQPLKGARRSVLRKGGNKGGKKDRHANADCLGKVAVAE